MRWNRLILAVGIATALAASVWAGDDAASDPVPLYTNEDLEKYGDQTASDPPKSHQDVDSPDWATVEKFLTRQYSRIDADRKWDMDRQRVISERIAALSVRPRYVLPWAYPFYRYRHRAVPYRTPASLGYYRPAVMPSHPVAEVHRGFAHSTPATRAIPGGGRRFGSATGLKGTAAVPTRPAARSRGRGSSTGR